MKKIKHLELSPIQLLSKEESRRIVAGDDWFLDGHQWDCPCVHTGDHCEERYFYTVGVNGGENSFFPNPLTGEIKNYKNIRHVMCYTQWLFTYRQAGTKYHDKIGVGQRIMY